LDFRPLAVVRPRLVGNNFQGVQTSTSMPGSVESLDSDSSSEISYDSDDESRLAQQEWDESIEQLQQLVCIVLLPFLGKWLGRRWSYWGEQQDPCSYSRMINNLLAYSRYLRLGLGMAFLFGERSPATAST
jgi:hypothetical protein